MLARLRDPDTRARIKAAIVSEDRDWASGGPGRIMLVSVLDRALDKYVGRTLEEIGRDEGKDPIDAMLDILLADRMNTYKIPFSMHEDDVRLALRHPLVAMCTDSGASAEDGILSEERSHPRGFASTARILGKYVREEKLLSLEEAIRKMTSLPASRVGLRDRGLLRPGMAAVVVVFDPERVRERSSYPDPNHYNEGFVYVAVNGELVLDAGRLTAARPGRPLLGPGAADKMRAR